MFVSRHEVPAEGGEFGKREIAQDEDQDVYIGVPWENEHDAETPNEHTVTAVAAMKVNVMDPSELGCQLVNQHWAQIA